MIEKYRGYEIEYSETYSTSPMIGRVKYSSALIRRAGESKILHTEETIEQAKRWIETQPKLNTAESRRNEGQEAYGSKQDNTGQPTAIDNLREGVAVEKEHADMIVWLKQYVAAHDGEFPPDTEIQARIAQKHLEEDPNYYKELAKMENKNADEHREHTPIVSQQQADFFGAEIGRKERGEKGQTDMSIEELKRHLREWGKKNKLNVSDFEISKAYADAVNSGLRGNKAFATAAHNLGISTDDVLNARERMLNPLTPEAKRDEGSRLYGSRENAKPLMDLFLKKSDFKNPGDEGTVGDRTFRLIRKTGKTNPEGDEQWEVEIIK